MEHILNLSSPLSLHLLPGAEGNQSVSLHYNAWWTVVTHHFTDRNNKPRMEKWYFLDEQKKKGFIGNFFGKYFFDDRIYGQEEMVHFLKKKYFITAINYQVRDMSKKKITVTHHFCRTIQELILHTKQALCWQTVRTCQCNMLPSYW